MQIPFDTTQIRRGALFFAAIGVPVVFAVLRGDPQQAQLGAVLGLTLAFADNDKDLPRRLRLVVADGAGIALGAAAGFLVRNLAAALWPSFIVVAFATGLSARRGLFPLLTQFDDRRQQEGRRVLSCRLASELGCP